MIDKSNFYFTISPTIISLFLPLVINTIPPTIKPFYGEYKNEEELFTKAYVEDLWGGKQSKSGVGSDDCHTKTIIEEVPKALEKLNVIYLIDIGCGDCRWQSQANFSSLSKYIGVDIVAPLITKNKEDFAHLGWEFIQNNSINDTLPALPAQGSAILCRSVIPLLYFEDAIKLIQNCKKTGAEFFICTTYPRHMTNFEMPIDLRAKLWARPINMEKEPYLFPKPIFLINENLGNLFLQDKSLGVWRMADLKNF